MSRPKLFVERVPRPEFVALFLESGVLADVAGLVRESSGLLDLDFWVDSRANLERASIYCGLAKLLDIHAGTCGRLRVETTGLVRRRLGLVGDRAAWIPVEGQAQLAADVVTLVHQALPMLPESHTRAGRTLHATAGRVVLARNFGPRFQEEKVGGAWAADLADRVRNAVRGVEGIPHNLPPKPTCDALMIDQSGTLLLVEAEVPRSPEIGFSPVRATQQLALWDAWQAADPAALAHVHKLAALREVLGLCPAGTLNLVPHPETAGSIYVLATETSASGALLARMEQAAALLQAEGLLDTSRFRCELTEPS